MLRKFHVRLIDHSPAYEMNALNRMSANITVGNLRVC